MNKVALIAYHKDSTGQNFLASWILANYFKQELNRNYRLMQLDYLAQLATVTNLNDYSHIALIGQSKNTSARFNEPIVPTATLINNYQTSVDTQQLHTGNLVINLLGTGKVMQPISNLEILLKSLNINQVTFNSVINSNYSQDLALLEYAHGFDLTNSCYYWLNALNNPILPTISFKNHTLNLNINLDTYQLPTVSFNLYQVKNKRFALTDYFDNYLLTHLAKVKANAIFDIDMNSQKNSILRYQISDGSTETKQVFKDWINKFTFKAKEPMYNTGYAISPLNWHLIMESYLQK